MSADVFTENNSYMTLGLKFLLCLNGKLSEFKKNSIQILWIFSCNTCILVRLWVKVFVLQGWVLEKIAVNTL